MNLPLKIVFVSGSSRSGSTLLDILLGSMDGFFSTGELYHIWIRGLERNGPCGCGRSFRECPFWTEVIAAAFGKLSATDLEHFIRLQREHDSPRNLLMEAVYPGFEPNARSVEYQGVLKTLFEAVARVSGEGIIIDSSKTPMHGYALTRFAAPHKPGYLSLIHLIRDSRAVAYSWYKIRAREKSGGSLPLNLVRSAGFARGWVSANLFTHLLSRHVEAAEKVRYEDLAADPEATLSGLLRRFGFGDPSSLVRSEGGYDPRKHHTVSGNPMRLSTERITVRPDTAWKTRLPFSVKLAVTAGTFPWLARYGYPLLA